MPRLTGANGSFTRLSAAHAAARPGRLPPTGPQVSVQCRTVACGPGRTLIVSDAEGCDALWLAPPSAGCDPHAATSASTTTAAAAAPAAGAVEIFMNLGRLPAIRRFHPAHRPGRRLASDPAPAPRPGLAAQVDVRIQVGVRIDVSWV